LDDLGTTGEREVRYEGLCPDGTLGLRERELLLERDLEGEREVGDLDPLDRGERGDRERDLEDPEPDEEPERDLDDPREREPPRDPG
jgi:hypothetical protein